MSFSLEHIDPRKHHLVCGLKNQHNEVLADLTYNKAKNNRFIPYRICECNAPVYFGDICEFLIKDKWVVCEFGGPEWRKECRRVGFNSTKTGHRVGTRHKQNKTGIFSPLHADKISEARSRGCINAAASRRRPVKIISPAGETFQFLSCSAAGKHFSLNLGELSKCCRGLIPTVKGFRAEFT